MKQPEKDKTYKFLINGKGKEFRYIGTKGNRLVFEVNGHLTNMSARWFDFLFNHCNLDGVNED